MKKYSDQEIKLFSSLGYENIIGLNSIEPIVLYRMAAEEVFIKNISGPNVDALRRGLKAIVYCECHRNTWEFENLISY